MADKNAGASYKALVALLGRVKLIKAIVVKQKESAPSKILANVFFVCAVELTVT